MVKLICPQCGIYHWLLFSAIGVSLVKKKTKGVGHSVQPPSNMRKWSFYNITRSTEWAGRHIFCTDFLQAVDSHWHMMFSGFLCLLFLTGKISLILSVFGQSADLRMTYRKNTFHIPIK